MKINIYYGGRGIVDDPTLFALEKIENVLKELNAQVTRYNLYEHITGMSSLATSVKEADAVILATTLEWYGIGGYMQMFLDVCWMYADKEHLKSIYMFPVVMSKTYGEREARNNLMTAWELLGGKPLEGLSAYVDDTLEFEMDKNNVELIEKATENLYRAVSKKSVSLPTSNGVIKKNVIKEALNYTPKETEQLSKYVANEEYVKTQKQDIEDLSNMFKDLLKEQDKGGDSFYTKTFEEHFDKSDISFVLLVGITGKNKNILVNVSDNRCSAVIGNADAADITIKLSQETFEDIVNGRKTFQRGFMTGEITYKGDLAKLRKLDTVFKF